MTDGDAADAERIEELQATVDGLTNELMDLQERVRELEAEVKDEEPESDRSVEEMFAEADGGTEGLADEEDVETIGDDIIVG